MNSDPEQAVGGGAQTKPRYTWPWFVLGAVLLAIAMSILWMRGEVRRVRLIRDLNSTNSTPSLPQR